MIYSILLSLLFASVNCQNFGNSIGCSVCQNPSGNWNSWGSWSSCSMQGSVYGQIRSRTCDGGSCVGGSEEARPCEPAQNPCNTCNNNRLSSWSEWSLCFESSRGSLRERSRVCLIQPCNEQLQQTESCSFNDDPICDWDHWGQWSSCSNSCGRGYRNRVRTCNCDPYPNGEPSQQEICESYTNCPTNPCVFCQPNTCNTCG